MDPEVERITAALLHQHPTMSPEYARSIARQIQPSANAGYGTAANGYDVVDDTGVTYPNPGRIAAAESIAAQEASTTPIYSGPEGPVALAKQYLDEQAAKRHMLAQRDQMQKATMLMQRDDSAQARMVAQRDASMDAVKRLKADDAANSKASPPTVVGNPDEKMKSQRIPYTPTTPQYQAYREKQGLGPDLRPDAVSAADPRTVRDPVAEKKKQRVAAYYGLMAKQTSGQPLTPEESQWLDLVHYGARNMKSGL